jgi:hypothetical protein
MPRKSRGVLSLQVLPDSERKVLLAKAVGNPLDFRTDEEMAHAFGYTLAQYSVIRRSKHFNSLVEEEFHNALPGVKVDIFKRLARLATQNSSIPAARLILQWVGELDSPGTIKVQTGGVSEDSIPRLSPEELDATIVRLLRDTAPEDVSMEGWRVTCQGNIHLYQKEADYEILDDPGVDDTPGRVEFSGEEA